MAISGYGTGVLASTIAEFVSSFYFVFCSCIATAFWSTRNTAAETSILFVAVLSGISLAVVSYCSCEITKACANPVVTITLYLTQRLDRLRFLLFLPAQVLGGISGAAFHYVLTPHQDIKPGTLLFNEDLELIQGFVIEFILSVLFVFGLFTVFFPTCTECCEKRSGKSWKIGIVYTLCVMIDFPYTGGGLNPSLLLGQAITRNHWGNYKQVNHWVYWTAPVLGGALGGILYEVWTSARDLNDVDRHCHFKRMVALLVVFILVITFAVVVIVAL